MSWSIVKLRELLNCLADWTCFLTESADETQHAVRLVIDGCRDAELSDIDLCVQNISSTVDRPRLYSVTSSTPWLDMTSSAWWWRELSEELTPLWLPSASSSCCRDWAVGLQNRSSMWELLGLLEKWPLCVVEWQRIELVGANASLSPGH